MVEGRNSHAVTTGCPFDQPICHTFESKRLQALCLRVKYPIVGHARGGVFDEFLPSIYR
jgi:hypothetical protein